DGRRMLAETRPDVLLLDELLPDGSGIDAAADLSEVVPGMRILILTSVEDDRVVAAAMQNGCSGVVTKDRPLEELLRAIRAVARGQSVFDAAALIGPARNSTGPGSDLTPREHDVLRLLADGVSNAEIASRLGLSLNTVRNYIQTILGKLDAHSKLEAVAIAARRGLVQVGRSSGGSAAG
ncbi:MAG TPA: response regulator transcription factor, partial [Actinomycetota bacterium]|nr:response regulator transcription factor [Actinomycetota bacterium]